MKKTIFLLAFCLTITGVYAQKFSVKGRVIDADSKDYIVGASVRVNNGTVGMVTDINGRYFFNEVEEGDILWVSFTGYKDEDWTIKHSGTQPDIELEEETGFVLQSKIPFSSYDKYTEEQPKQ